MKPSLFPPLKYVIGYDGVRIATYDNQLQGKGKVPVVLLHGLLSRAEAMNEAMRLLTDAGYRSLALDLRAHGSSDAPVDSSAYLNQAMARDVIEVLRRLEIAKFAVIAYGVGSELTARIWNLGKRFERAVICGWGGHPQELINQYESDAWKLQAEELASAMESVEPSEIADPNARAWRNAAERGGMNRKAIAARLRSGDSGEAGLDPTTITAPVLAICGSQDANVQEFAEALPNAVSRTVEGSHTTAGKTDQLWRLAVDFVTSED